MQRLPQAHTPRVTHKKPSLAQRRSAPMPDEGWEDVFDRGGKGMGHNSPSLHRRRKTAHGTPRSAKGAEFNPFEADFALASNVEGVKTRPCRSATPEADKPKSLAADVKSAWRECREFLARIVALVVQDYIANFMKTEGFQQAKGHASAYAARAGAHMGAAAGGPAGAALG